MTRHHPFFTLMTIAGMFVLSGCGNWSFGPACASNGSCSGSIPTAPSTALTGSLTDTVGDALPVAAVPPDVTGATLTVESGALIVDISFASGTFSTDRTAFSLFLDTDEKQTTGYQAAAGVGAEAYLTGWEYVIRGLHAADSTSAAIYHAEAIAGSSLTFVDTVAVTFPAAGRARVVVPLSRLGNDNGRLWFRFVALDKGVDGVLRSADYMPEAGQASGIVR
jgi:hypothetical protein